MVPLINPSVLYKKVVGCFHEIHHLELRELPQTRLNGLVLDDAVQLVADLRCFSDVNIQA